MRSPPTTLARTAGRMSSAHLARKRESNGTSQVITVILRGRHFSNDRLNFKHALVAADGPQKGIFAAARRIPLGKASVPLRQAGRRPTAHELGHGLDRRFVERKTDRRSGKLLAIAHENAALADQPDRRD